MKDVEIDNTSGNTQFQWSFVDLVKEMNGLFNYWFWKKHIHKLNFMIQLSYTLEHETTELVYKGLCEQITIQNSVLNKDLKTRCRVC